MAMDSKGKEPFMYHLSSESNPPTEPPKGDKKHRHKSVLVDGKAVEPSKGERKHGHKNVLVDGKAAEPSKGEKKQHKSVLVDGKEADSKRKRHRTSNAMKEAQERKEDRQAQKNQEDGKAQPKGKEIRSKENQVEQKEGGEDGLEGKETIWISRKTYDQICKERDACISEIKGFLENAIKDSQSRLQALLTAHVISTRTE